MSAIDAETSDRVTVYLVDDYGSFRDAFVAHLEDEESLQLLGAAASTVVALPDIHALRPDVAIIDAGLRGTGGRDLVRRIVRGPSATRVLVLAACDGGRVVADPDGGGRVASVPKTAPWSQIREAIALLAD